MVERHDKFIPLYESIGKVVTPAVEKEIVGIRIEYISEKILHVKELCLITFCTILPQFMREYK